MSVFIECNRIYFLEAVLLGYFLADILKSSAIVLPLHHRDPFCFHPSWKICWILPFNRRTFEKREEKMHELELFSIALNSIRSEFLTFVPCSEFPSDDFPLSKHFSFISLTKINMGYIKWGLWTLIFSYMGLILVEK